jgi:hypothetical protein
VCDMLPCMDHLVTIKERNTRGKERLKHIPEPCLSPPQLLLLLSMHGLDSAIVSHTHENIYGTAADPSMCVYVSMHHITCSQLVQRHGLIDLIFL